MTPEELQATAAFRAHRPERTTLYGPVDPVRWRQSRWSESPRRLAPGLTR